MPLIVTSAVWRTETAPVARRPDSTRHLSEGVTIATPRARPAAILQDTSGHAIDIAANTNAGLAVREARDPSFARRRCDAPSLTAPESPKLGAEARHDEGEITRPMTADPTQSTKNRTCYAHALQVHDVRPGFDEDRRLTSRDRDHRDGGCAGDRYADT